MWFKSKKEVEVKKIVLIENIIFNVNNFNAWFCDDNNNAIYANKGIFKRIDKLSQSHIDDYLDKCYNINDNNIPGFMFSKPFIELKMNLYRSVLDNWK